MEKNLDIIVCLIFIVLAVFDSTQLLAQSNTGFKYQAVIRDAEGLPIKEMDMDIRLSIVDGEEIIYSEVHQEQTSSEFGIIGINVGTGNVEEGLIDNLADLNWSEDNYSLRVELDIQDDESPGWVMYGESPILSVPHAMYAERVKNSDDADADASNELQNLSFENNVLSISNGNSVTIDIENKDEQILSLAGPNLSISGGNTINLAPIITQSGDPSSTNEIQTLSVEGNTISISGDGGNSIELPTEETLQTLELQGNELSITGGNSVTLNTVVTENRTDEIQQLELDGNELTISGAGGNTILLPSSDGVAQTINYDQANYKVTLSDGGGEIDLSNLKDVTGTGTGTDDQRLTLNNTTLEIEDGNQVNLSEFKQDIDYDNSTNTLSISGGKTITLSGNGGDPTDELQTIVYDAVNYKVTLSDGGGEIDLSNLKDVAGTGTGTDDQRLTLNNTTLEIEDGNDVDLSGFHQEISFDATTNELDITNGNTITLPITGGDPTDEIQMIDYDAANYMVTLSNGGGVIDLSNLKDVAGTGTGTDDQRLTLNNTTLEIEDGNDVDLSGFHQEISYDATTNELEITNGNTITIPGIVDTDDQEITNAELDGTNLIIEIENGNQVNIDLSSLAGSGGSDDQQLSFDPTSNELTLDDGGSVDLTGLAEDGDADPENEIQRLEIDNNRLTITGTGGNTITLPSGPSTGSTALLIDDDADTKVYLEEGNLDEVKVDVDGDSLAVFKKNAFGDPMLEFYSKIWINPANGNHSRTRNTYVGNGAGKKTEGIFNSFFGDLAGSNNKDADSNSFFGAYAGHNNVSGYSNSFFGAGAASDITDGGGNVAIGNNVMGGSENVYDNVVIGLNAGYDLVGDGNIIIGSNIGDNVGDNNLIMGSNSDKLIHGDISIGSLAIGGSLPPTGSNSFSFGNGPDASGRFSFAGGNGAVASGESSISLGNSNSARGLSSIAMGQGTAATADHAIAIGHDSYANGPNSFIIGYNSIVEKQYGYALGSNNEIRGDYGFAFGYGNQFTGEEGGAIGFRNKVSSEEGGFAIGFENESTNLASFAYGVENLSSGIGAFSIGTLSEATGDFSLAIGNENNAQGDHSIAIGNLSTANLKWGIAIGDNTTALGEHTIAMGNSTVAGGTNSFAVGASAKTGGNASVAMGLFTEANESFSLAFGNRSKALGEGAIAGGLRNTAEGVASVAFGQSTYAGGMGSFVAGTSSSAIGNNSLAIGQENLASNSNSIAVGYGNITPGENSISAGFSNQSEGYNSVALGQKCRTTGQGAIALGSYSNALGNTSVSIGSGATASGLGSMALGSEVTASGSFSTALGRRVSTNGHYGAFIIGDGNELSDPTLSGAKNQFVARFQNGYWFMTSSDQNRTGVFARGGDNAWSSISDVNRKVNFQLMDDEATLDKLASVDYTSWNYKSQDPSTRRHYGIMAQDFFRLFGKDDHGTIGVDTLVNPIDMMGVSMSAIKGAAKKIHQNEDLDKIQAKEIAELNQKVDQLLAENEQLKTQLIRANKFEARLSALEAKGSLTPDQTKITKAKITMIANQ